MSDFFRSALRSTWSRNSAYAQRLVGDLSAAQFLAQPVPGRVINHPAWVLCHLNVYGEIVARVLRSEVVEDPLGKPFARGSNVTHVPSDYPEPPAIVGAFTRLHEQAGAALDAAPDELFASPVPLDRLRPVAPTVGALLVMLMVKHESFHLGQLSAWRRAMGLVPVEM